MHERKSRTLVACVLVGLVGSAPAQGGEAVGEPARGQWVRVTLGAQGETVLEGRLQALDADTLVLAPPGREPVAVTRERIHRVERRQGRSRVAGALLGAAAGLAGGHMAGAFAGSDGPDCQIVCFSSGDKGALLSFLTVPLGALIGVGITHPRWEDVALPDRPAVALVPLRGGAAVQVSVRF